MKIDAVITWVDGSDPLHKQKREKYGDPSIFKSEDVAAATRFANSGEINWCVASLNIFAPFINKIYIVTDNQDPKIDSFLKEKFPNGHIPVEIVDHKDFYKGYEQYLPTFNSVALESITWRIPGLSEHFIEFNDDMFLCAPTTPEDFFTPDGKPVCYASRMFIPFVKFTRLFKKKHNGTKKVTFKGLMIQGSELAGSKLISLKMTHNPRPLLKSAYEDYFKAHPESLVRNLQYRFRNMGQFTPQILQYTLLTKAKRCVRKSIKGKLLFIRFEHGSKRLKKKIALLERNNSIKFCCINSLDMASESDFNLVTRWINQRLGL